MTRVFSNVELAKEVVKLRTIIWEKRDSMDGYRELFEDLLSDYEEDLAERIKTLRSDIEELEISGSNNLKLEFMYNELDYLEMMLWEVTGYSQGGEYIHITDSSTNLKELADTF